MTTVEQLQITEPGVYDIPAEAYHADPVVGGSLSRTGAKQLLPPSCPALYRYEQDHGGKTSKALDLGSAAHKVALGVGPKIVVVEGDRWDTKIAKAEVAAARAAGHIPLKAADAATIDAMVEALRAHPIAGPMFAPATGLAEQTLIWVDRATGVWCRSRPDWLPDADRNTGRLIIPEYKTTESANPASLSRPAYDYGYHLQTWWVQEAARALGLSPAPLVTFVFQEKRPPYLVSVVQPRETFVNLGGLLARRAMSIYRECVETGRWPGYTGVHGAQLAPEDDEVEWLSLPGWVENQWGDQIQ